MTVKNILLKKKNIRAYNREFKDISDDILFHMFSVAPMQGCSVKKMKIIIGELVIVVFFGM